MADRSADRHKQRAIPYRPESDEERAWLLKHAKATSRDVVDVLRQAVREYRASRREGLGMRSNEDRRVIRWPLVGQHGPARLDYRGARRRRALRGVAAGLTGDRDRGPYPGRPLPWRVLMTYRTRWSNSVTRSP